MDKILHLILGQIDWTQIITNIAIVAVPAVLGLAGKLLLNMIAQSKTKIDDRLAGIAVSYAEDKLGDGRGHEKLESAIQKLMELTGGRMNRKDAELLVRTAYQNLYGALKPLKNE